MRRTPMIYLDHNASSPIRPEALDAVVAGLRLAGGNPNSGHSGAAAARRMLEEARRRIARLLGARPSEITFTSGGTESNNLAIGGLFEARAPRPRIVTLATEHPSVLAAARALSARGAEVEVVGVDGEGRADLAALSEALDDDTALCAVMLANNETGVVQDIGAIAEACRARGVPLHTDAVQAVGKLPVTLPELGAATVTFTAHKLGGPIGIGALFSRRGQELCPLTRGGGQERGLRPGTQPYALAHGFAAALEAALADLPAMAALARRRDRFEADLRRRFPDVIVWSEGAPRLPNTSFFALPGSDGAALLASLDEAGIQVGTGAACGTAERTPSHVLTALGASPAEAHATLRVSGWAGTSDEEWASVIEVVIRSTRV